MKKSVFISYASKELKKANEVCSYLEKEGVSCWIAPRDILPGTEYGEAIICGIEECSTLVLIYSEASSTSKHVLREVERAVSKNVPIIAYKIEDAPLSKSMEYFLLTNQWLDATGKGNHLAELLSSVNVILGEKNCSQEEGVFFLPKTEQGRNLGITIFCSIVAVIGLIIVLSLALSRNNQEPKGSQAQFAIEDGQKETNRTEKEDTNRTEPEGIEQEETSDTVLSTQIVAEGKQEPNTTNPSGIFEQGENNKPVHDNDGNGNDGIVSNDSESLGTEKTEKPEGQEVESVGVNLEVGQYIKYGRYKPQGYKGNSEDSVITWLVVNVDQNKQRATLLAKEVLDMKPFDCAESGEFDKLIDGQMYHREQKQSYSFDEMIQFRGNNDWKNSNIRTWLNSSEAKVRYSDQAPVNKGTDTHSNGYDKQPGFLYDFSEEEISILCKVRNVTASNVLNAENDKQPVFDFESGYITDDFDFSSYACNTTEDKVYLLSVDEVIKYLYQQGLPIYANPTQAAIDSGINDYYTTGLAYGVTTSIWALRTPNGADSHRVLCVERGISGTKDFVTHYASAGGLGIRPAVTISYAKLSIDGDGSEDNPYTIK